MNIFKGYIPTNGKRPTEKYKDRSDFYILEDVENLNSYGGVLADDFIQVDVDDEGEADILFTIVEDLNVECHVLKTTRGMHFYFKNTNIDARKQGYITPISIKIDIGLGIQNAVIPLKIDGECREWLKQTDDIEPLPKWLIPLYKRGFNFKDMEDGDGRNSSLFTYILKLQGAGLTKEEIRETIRIINKYILSEPLDKSEIETILRDESFLKETFYIKGKLQYQPLAEYLRDNEKIIKINDELHIYEDGYYKQDDLAIERTMLKYMTNSSNGQRQEIIKYLELICENKKMSSPRYVVLKNGVLDLRSMDLLPHDEKYIIKNKIDWEYNPEAYDETMDNTLDKICVHDKKLRMLVEEMIGYTFLRRNELGKCFILTGGGSNGKSTLFEVMNLLIGEKNVSNVALKELGQRFKAFQLDGKLANIGDDISNEYIPDSSMFKNLCTGDKVNVERKGKDAYDMRSYAKLIFSANELPRINDLTDGLKRRLIFIPFKAKFSKKDKDFNPFILDDLTEERAIEYLLKVALEGLQRVLMNNSFTNPKVCEKVWKDYEEINNPVMAFLNENDLHNTVIADAYRMYSVYCEENGLKSLSKPVFGREVKKMGYESNKTIRIKGKVKKIYTKVRVDEEE